MFAFSHQMDTLDASVVYFRIVMGGMLFNTVFMTINAAFRGCGHTRLTFVSNVIACIVNIVFNYLLIEGHFGFPALGIKGAAIATVFAQAISVVISFFLIRRKKLPFDFSKKYIKINKQLFGRITKLGLPIALQDLLVGISFLIIQAIVNSLGLLPSAGVGVAEKVCGFIMLVPASFMQAMSAFVAQNAGAKLYDRAVKALRCGIAVSICAGVVMFYISFFHGDLLSSVFSSDS